MTKETKDNIVQGISICQKHLQHAWVSKPNGDYVIIPGRTAEHTRT